MAGHFIPLLKSALSAITFATVTPGLLTAQREVSPEMLAEYSTRYLRELRRPGAQDTVFWAVTFAEQRGVRYLTYESDSGSVLLLFSSPFFLYRYATNAPDVPSPFRMVGWSATMATQELLEIRDQSQVRVFTIDRSYRCPTSDAFRIENGMSDGTLQNLWLAMRTVSHNLGKRHYPTALAAAKDGDFSRAVQLVTDLIGCSVPEEPRLHLLAGACGIALGDGALVARSVDALRWLDPAAAERLDGFARDAVPLQPHQRGEVAVRVLGIMEDLGAGILEP